MFAEGSLMISLLAATHPGEDFRQVLPYVLITALVVLVLYSLVAAFRRQRNDPKSRWSAWEMLVYLLTLISVGILGVTAFYPLLQDQRMGAWMLFAHMVGAGMFVFTLPVLALTWCEPSRFDLRPVGQRGAEAPRRFYWLPKLLFWTLLAAGLVVSMTMLVGMTSLFGTLGQQTLLDLHRFVGLIVVLALAFHLNCVLLQRVGWR